MLDSLIDYEKTPCKNHLSDDNKINSLKSDVHLSLPMILAWEETFECSFHISFVICIIHNSISNPHGVVYATSHPNWYKNKAFGQGKLSPNNSSFLILPYNLF